MLNRHSTILFKLFFDYSLRVWMSFKKTMKWKHCVGKLIVFSLIISRSFLTNFCHFKWIFFFKNFEFSHWDKHSRLQKKTKLMKMKKMNLLVFPSWSHLILPKNMSHDNFISYTLRVYGRSNFFAFIRNNLHVFPSLRRHRISSKNLKF